MLVGSPPGAPASPIGRLPAISVTVPLTGSISMMRLAPTSATISLPLGASAMPSGIFRSCAMMVLSPLLSTFDTCPEKASVRYTSSFDAAKAAVAEPDRVVRSLEAVHHLPGLAGLAVDHLHRAGEPARQDHLVAL